MKIYNVGPEALQDYALERVDETKYDWVVYHYTTYGYEGGGELVALGKNGLLHCTNLGHCSCNDPVDDFGNGHYVELMTTEVFKTGPDNIFDNDYSLVKPKILELLGK